MNTDNLRNDINKLQKLFEPLQRVAEVMQDFDVITTTISENKSHLAKIKKEAEQVAEDLAASKLELSSVKQESLEMKAKAKRDAQEREQKSKDKATEIVVGATSMRDAVLREHVQAKNDLAATKLELGKRQSELDDLNKKIEKAKDVVKNIFSNPVD